MAEALPSGSSEDPDLIREPYYRLAAVKHEYDALEKLAQDVKNDVKEIKMEVDDLELENKWCYNESGERIRLSASQEADRIITESNNYPDLLQDIIGNLNQKKSELQSTVAGQDKKLQNSLPKDAF